MEMKIHSFYDFDFVVENIGQIILSVTFVNWEAIQQNDYDPLAFTLYVMYNLSTNEYIGTEICESGEPIPYSLEAKEEEAVLNYIAEKGLENKLFVLNDLYIKIKDAFNSEMVNYLIEQLQQCNSYAFNELLHVMSVSCDLKNPGNKKYKALYDELVSTQYK